MKTFLSSALLLVAASGARPLWGQSLEAVLASMDAAAPGFRAMTAKMDRLSHVAVIDDNSSEEATVRVVRLKNRDLRVAIDFTKPDNKQVAIGDRKAEVFYPKTNTVQEWDLGKYKSLVDQFVLLGFGTSGKDLAKNYGLKFLKEDSIHGQKCSRLELLPKSAQVKQNYKRIELCVATPGGYPVQQKLFEASGNYTSISYSNVKLNPDLKPEQVALKLPAGVKREYPQR